MAYTPQKPPLPETSEQLRARIPGWGADLDRADRPAVPREQPGIETGARWEFPERQPELWPRERSVEHAFLTPVFGTSTPPKGVSGMIRKYAYRRFSEARAAHWLLLIAADRVDTLESTVGSFASRRPDNLVTETGVLSEISHHGLRSRAGQGRTDVRHAALDPVVVLAPWVLGGTLVVKGALALARRRSAAAG